MSSSNYCGILSSKDPSEVIPYSLDFRPVLESGDSIVSASIAISYLSGPIIEVSPTLHTTGLVNISGTQVGQLFTGGTDKNTYHLRFTVTTTNENTLILSADLPVELA